MTVHALKRKRYLYLFAAAISFLVLGLVYAWSLFATPLAEIYGWEMSAVKVTFTICMMAFCVGGLIGVRVLRRLGLRFSLQPRMALRSRLPDDGDGLWQRSTKSHCLCPRTLRTKTFSTSSSYRQYRHRRWISLTAGRYERLRRCESAYLHHHGHPRCRGLRRKPDICSHHKAKRQCR